ncbi:MAG: hypothetical protein GXP28_12160 [Planctomycetes bacterium]|nr:hypothetical protein [Planctomycetota bacterium]
MRWVDQDGFELIMCYGSAGKKVEPGETRHFSGTNILDPEEARLFYEVTMDITE